MKNEILLSGNIPDSEINEIQSFISESNVIKMQTKAFDPTEVIQLVFQDFNLLSFTRDFFLGGLLTGTLTQVKLIIDFFKKRRKPIALINIEVKVKQDDMELLLYISSTPENLDLTIDLTNQKMEFIFNLIDKESFVQVILSKNGSELEINKM